MEQPSQTNEKIYRYSSRRRISFATILVFHCVFFTFLAFDCAITLHQYGASIFFFFLSFLGIVYFGAYHLQYASIVLSDDGIASRIWGHDWRSIRWGDVRKIRKVREYNVDSWSPPWSPRRFITRFYIHTRESWDKHEARRARLFPLYRRRGFLMFDQSILQLNSLLDAINSYAARYRIELASVDREPDSKKNRANNVWFEVRARDERETPIARL